MISSRKNRPLLPLNNLLLIEDFECIYGHTVALYSMFQKVCTEKTHKYHDADTIISKCDALEFVLSYNILAQNRNSYTIFQKNAGL